MHPATTASVAARIPGARYEGIRAASHSVASEQPDLIASLIAGFLATGGETDAAA